MRRQIKKSFDPDETSGGIGSGAEAMQKPFKSEQDIGQAGHSDHQNQPKPVPGNARAASGSSDLIGKSIPSEVGSSGPSAAPGRAGATGATGEAMWPVAPLPRSADAQQVSAYIFDLAVPLRNVASRAGLDFLAYLLDMVAEEADGLSRKATSPASRRSVSGGGAG